MSSSEDTPAIARAANARNNAAHQPLRLARWTDTRDALWTLLDPLLAPGARVALVGAGSCDDVPLRRIVQRAGSVDLIDFDDAAMNRAIARIDVAGQALVTLSCTDVTGGSADLVLAAVRDATQLPDALPLPYSALGRGDYELVVGDMLYTQLLHAGLIELGVQGARQHELMQRYDPPLVRALVQRIQSSLAPGGHAVHVHDLACWAHDHPQPVSLDEVLADPDATWLQLRRHDQCDPHVTLETLGITVGQTNWWAWPFEPNKQFVVRASVTRTAPGLAGAAPWLLTAR